MKYGYMQSSSRKLRFSQVDMLAVISQRRWSSFVVRHFSAECFLCTFVRLQPTKNKNNVLTDLIIICDLRQDLRELSQFT
jgi:hypothetical protein